MNGGARSLSVVFALVLVGTVAALGASSCSSTPKPPPPAPGHPLTSAELALRANLGVPKDAKKVIVFGQNAHMDIDWQKTFDDYYASYVGQILVEARQILATQPRAFYSVAEMAFLEHHLEMHPEELAPLKAASQAGSLHIVGGGMTSPDTVLPETELLLRDYLYGIQFAEDTLDAHPTAAWLPDSFGHSGTTPDILAAAGYKSVAFSRIDGAPTLFEQIFHGHPAPKPGSTAEKLLNLGSDDFVWTGPGGGSVVAHFMAAPGLYCEGDNIDYAEGDGVELPGGHTGSFHGDDPSFTDQAIDRYITAMEPDTKTPYMFVPVGCDFAHPKEQLVDYLDGYNQRRYPTTGVWAVAAPFDLYSELVSSWTDVIPHLTADLTPYFMGFYGSRAGVKRGIRDAARPFFVAETFATALGAAGQALTQATASELKLLTRADHHDFVPGTAADDVVANEEMPLLAGTSSAAQKELANVASAIAKRVPIQPNAAFRVMALNPAGVARSDVATFQLPIAGGVVPALDAIADGTEVPLEVVGTPMPTDTTATVRLGLTSMPPFSWRAIDLIPGSAKGAPSGVSLNLEDANGAPATGQAIAQVVLSNASVTAMFVKGSNGFALTSLLLGGKEIVAHDSGLFQDYNDMGGLWRLGNEMDGCSLTPETPAPPDETLEVLDATNLMARVVFHSSTADREAALSFGDTGLSFAVTTGAAMGTTRTVSFSLAVPSDAVLETSEPGGSEVRPAEQLYTPTFWPAVSFARVGGAAILLRQSTGVRMSTPGEIELMAVRDARSEQCDVEGGVGSDTDTHRIEWRIEPAADAVAAEQAAQAWNRPLDAEIVPLDQGATLDLPRQASLLGVSGAGIVSALKPADRGHGIILRVLLTPGPVTVTLPWFLVGKQGTHVDVAERDGVALGIAQNQVIFDQATYGAIASVRFE